MARKTYRKGQIIQVWDEDEDRFYEAIVLRDENDEVEARFLRQPLPGWDEIGMVSKDTIRPSISAEVAKRYGVESNPA